MRRFAFFAALLALTALVTGGVAIADSGKTITTRGDEVLEPNKFVRADLRFSPGSATIKSGEEVTWTAADKAGAPHTVTLATPNQLVQNFSDFILGTCPDCDAAQGAALAGHFPGGPPVPVLDDGDGEFNNPGDSLLLFAGDSVTRQINVASGTTLFFFCAIHPWMQGEIRVG